MLLRATPVALAIALVAACGGKSEVADGDDDAGSGGTSASGGASGKGTGGTSPGGSSTGATGGSVSTGGTGAVGGSVSTGGTGAIGGSVSTGGAGAVGGSVSSGGSVSTGGSFTGGSGGDAGSGASGGVGGSGCCLAFPTCPTGEHQIAGPGDCPPEASACHEVSVCCSSIWCASDTTQCAAVPTCDAGDTALETPCPPDTSCYSRTVCGSTIWCVKAGCNPDTEYGRSYVSEDPNQCLLIDFACPQVTTPFSNDCGCGCEQPADCPEFFSCLPNPGAADAAPPSGAAPAPIPQPPLACDPAEVLRCPYTTFPIR